METSLGMIDGGDVNEVRRELDRQWRLARDDVPTRASLAARGIDLLALEAIGANPLTAEREGGNRADIATMILIGIAVKVGSDAASKALQMFWDTIVRPQIEKRFGKIAPLASGQSKPDA